jgi:tryptophan-rich sensory protein
MRNFAVLCHIVLQFWERAIIKAMKPNWAVELWGWCLAVFVAAFMPWGAVGTTSLFGISVSSIVTGWSGYTTLFGIIVPNWTVVICALAIALLHWLSDSGYTGTNPRLPQILAGYGIVHALLFIYSIISYGGSRIGIGAVITLIGFIAIFRSLRRNTPATAMPRQGSPVPNVAAPKPPSPQASTQQLPDQD